MTPKEAIEAGSLILEPLLGPKGLVFVMGPSGDSSGGAFAQGTFVRDDRQLELHFRHALGLVTYRVGALSLLHEDYMEALLGRRGVSRYPGFPSDPLDEFRGLEADLREHCMNFIAGPADEFRRCVARAGELAKRTGFQRLLAREDG